MNTRQLIEGRATATTQLMQLLGRLQQVRKDIEAIDWNDAQIRDRHLGDHMTAFEAHLDNAAGRLSTVIQHIRRTPSLHTTALDNPQELAREAREDGPGDIQDRNPLRSADGRVGGEY